VEQPQLKSWIPNCKEATLLSVVKEDKKLSLGLQIKLFIHLLYCSPCRAFVNQSKKITHILSNFKNSINSSPSQSLSFAKKEAMQNQINERLKNNSF
jgi:hypothetical protein